MNKNLQILIFLFFFILSGLEGISQTEIGSQEFFDRALSLIPQLATSLVDGPDEQVKFPWVEELEFRTETRDFDPEDQEYTFRVSPSTPGKRRAQQALYEHFKNAVQFENQEFICDAMLDANADWTSLYILENNLKLLQRLQLVFQDKRKVFERMITSLELPFDKIIDFEAEQTDLNFAMEELEIARGVILKNYNFENVALNFEDFISSEEIIHEIQESKLLPNLRNLEEIAYDQEEVQRELDLELAEKKQYFDFAQVRYEGPHTDFLNERLSLSVGFRIPNSGNRKLRIKELEFRQKELQQESERETLESNIRLARTVSSIEENIAIIKIFEKLKSEERQKLQSWTRLISARADFSPLVLLEVEERSIELQLKELDLKEDLLDNYLRLLNQTGAFCEGPVGHLQSQ